MYRSGRKRLLIGILIVVLLLAVLGGGVYFLLHTYTIKQVYVDGNVHYSKEEIEAIVMEGPFGNNSLYLSMKYKNKGVENIPFVDVMDVSILAPDTIRISVYEKALAGYIKYLDTYMYFDKDGYVVESSDIKTVGVPQITGLHFDHLVLGERLPVEDSAVFGNIMTITKLLNKYELVVDKIFFHSNGDITVYFDEIRVKLGGNYDALEEKFMLLPQLLEKLEGKSGTIDMAKSPSETKQYIFKPDL